MHKIPPCSMATSTVPTVSYLLTLGGIQRNEKSRYLRAEITRFFSEFDQLENSVTVPDFLKKTLYFLGFPVMPVRLGVSMYLPTYLIGRYLPYLPTRNAYLFFF